MKRIAWFFLTAALLLFVAAGFLYYEPITLKTGQFLALLGGDGNRQEEPEFIELYAGLSETLSGPEGTVNPELLNLNMESLALLITAGAQSDYDRVEAVYDWVTANFAYDLVKLKDMRAYGSGAEYLLQNGKGVCHDYAELIRALLSALGLETTFESGEVIPAAGETELHAWNHVRVDGVWYALDTTWGSGFIISDEDMFVQSPRRLYLTTPEELYRLHRDPVFKEEQEHVYLRARTAAADPAYLTDYEVFFIEAFNGYRSDLGLPALREEKRLQELLRQAGARIAQNVLQDEEYSLTTLEEQIRQRAGALNIRSAGMYAFVEWNYLPSTPDELLAQIVQEQLLYLENQVYSAVSVGVIRQGGITVVIHVYLQYH